MLYLEIEALKDPVGPCWVPKPHVAELDFTPKRLLLPLIFYQYPRFGIDIAKYFPSCLLALIDIAGELGALACCKCSIHHGEDSYENVATIVVIGPLVDDVSAEVVKTAECDILDELEEAKNESIELSVTEPSFRWQVEEAVVFSYDLFIVA